MSIPGYQTVMLPLLKLTSGGKEHQIREAVSTLADQFRLTEAERKETLPSRIGGIFDNRVGWTWTYLKKAPPIPRYQPESAIRMPETNH